MRYDRQIKLDEVGVSGQEKLRRSRVLVVGIGGLGCPAAQYLVGAGVGKIGLMDHDKVSLSNLHRQVLYDENDIGKSKAQTAKEKLQRLNSEIEIIAIEEALNKENAEALFSKYDIILDGSDNFETKYLINDISILSGKPWVYASIYKNEGQLSVFNFQDGPSYRCLFPKVTHQNVSCEATGVLGVTPGMLGVLQATEVLKMILGIGQVLSGKLKLIHILAGTEQILNIQKKPEEFEKVRKRGIITVSINCELKDPVKNYLDVREDFEQPKINSENVIHIPLGDLPGRFKEIPQKEEVLVFCQSGKRSQKAVEMLEKDFGFHNLKNVEGGIETIILDATCEN